MSIEEYFIVTPRDSVLVIQPKCRGGAFAEESSRAIWPQLLTQIKEQGGNVVIDMGALTFFGSTMLDMIATINKCLHPLDKKVALANISPTGMEVLSIARFDQFISVFDSLDQAIAELG